MPLSVAKSKRVKKSLSHTILEKLSGPLPTLGLLLCSHCGDGAPQNTGLQSLPPVAAPYAATLAPTESESEASYPSPVRAPEGAPNILLVMTDDVGFGSSSTFGGAVPTPNLDRLAARGLSYNRFHTTGICSPTRAALLTGRNHHAVGTGVVIEMPSPYPGYTSKLPRSAATVARILRDNGYNTAMFGKDHNVPADARSPAGPFDQWPTGKGFEYFYGFVAGDTDQWHPSLYEGISPVDSRDRPEGYLLDKELADKAIHWIHNQQGAAPDTPFFMYYATGSAHAPHQAPQAWIDKFRGKFDHGWDEERRRIFERQKAMGLIPAATELAARPKQVQAWDSLSEKQRQVYARFMEVYAGMLSYQDAQFGRILDELERMGIADNTLIMFIQGDNGASGEGGPQGTLNEMADLSSKDKHELPVDWLAEHLDELGGPNTYQGYPIGWTYATNTPYPWFKVHASHLGGVRNGLVVSWPKRIEQGGTLRDQYHHVIDVMPTLLEAAGIAPPQSVDGVAQQRIDGKSMVYSFNTPNAPTTRDTQYYEVLGNRGIYHKGWLANTTPRNMPWAIANRGSSTDVTTYNWELYDLRNDFAQAHDLAAEHPQKLAELQALFDQEARRNQVYPLQDSGGMHRAMQMISASGGARMEYVYWGPGIQLQMMRSPMIFMLNFSIEADLDLPDNHTSGVVVASGSHFGGWSFFMQDGRPAAVASTSPLPGGHTKVLAPSNVPSGKHTLRYEFSMTDEGGELTILVDGDEVARKTIPKRPQMMAGNGETFDTGRDTNVQVTADYHNGGEFEGQIEKITVKLRPGLRQIADYVYRLVSD